MHQCCEEGENKWLCDKYKACCNGGCCPEGLGCCNGQCYDPLTKQCCGEELCDLDDCKYCVDGHCESWCDPGETCCEGECCNPANCESCDGEGHCLFCGGEPFKGCCNGECYDARGQGCCNGQIYDIETHKCCEGFATTELCPKTRECCPSGECCNLDNCQWCNPENGGCYDLCERCQECIAGYCIPCAFLDKVCCDGWCEQPCEQQMKNDCNPSNDTDCFKCPDPEKGCGSKRVYTGYSTTTCSGGCFGDCHDVNDEICYTEYGCKVVSITPDQICAGECIPFIEPPSACAECGIDPKDQGTPHPSTQDACK